MMRLVDTDKLSGMEGDLIVAELNVQKAEMELERRRSEASKIRMAITQYIQSCPEVDPVAEKEVQ